MSARRGITVAVAGLAVDLGSAFRPRVVSDLAERLENLQRDQVARLENLSARIGIAPPSETEAMAWANTLELVLRCVAIGTETNNEKETR